MLTSAQETEINQADAEGKYQLLNWLGTKINKFQPEFLSYNSFPHYRQAVTLQINEVANKDFGNNVKVTPAFLQRVKTPEGKATIIGYARGHWWLIYDKMANKGELLTYAFAQQGKSHPCELYSECQTRSFYEITVEALDDREIPDSLYNALINQLFNQHPKFFIKKISKILDEFIHNHQRTKKVTGLDLKQADTQPELALNPQLESLYNNLQTESASILRHLQGLINTVHGFESKSALHDIVNPEFRKFAQEELSKIKMLEDLKTTMDDLVEKQNFFSSQHKLYSESYTRFKQKSAECAENTTTVIDILVNNSYELVVNKTNIADYRDLCAVMGDFIFNNPDLISEDLTSARAFALFYFILAGEQISRSQELLKFKNTCFLFFKEKICHKKEGILITDNFDLGYFCKTESVNFIEVMEALLNTDAMQILSTIANADNPDAQTQLGEIYLLLAKAYEQRSHLSDKIQLYKNKAKACLIAKTPSLKNSKAIELLESEFEQDLDILITLADYYSNAPIDSSKNPVSYYLDKAKDLIEAQILPTNEFLLSMFGYLLCTTKYKDDTALGISILFKRGNQEDQAAYNYLNKLHKDVPEAAVALGKIHYKDIQPGEYEAIRKATAYFEVAKETLPEAQHYLNLISYRGTSNLIVEQMVSAARAEIEPAVDILIERLTNFYQVNYDDLEITECLTEIYEKETFKNKQFPPRILMQAALNAEEVLEKLHRLANVTDEPIKSDALIALGEYYMGKGEFRKAHSYIFQSNVQLSSRYSFAIESVISYAEMRVLIDESLLTEVLNRFAHTFARNTIEAIFAICLDRQERAVINVMMDNYYCRIKLSPASLFAILQHHNARELNILSPKNISKFILDNFHRNTIFIWLNNNHDILLRLLFNPAAMEQIIQDKECCQRFKELATKSFLTQIVRRIGFFENKELQLKETSGIISELINDVLSEVDKNEKLTSFLSESLTQFASVKNFHDFTKTMKRLIDENPLLSFEHANAGYHAALN